MINKVAFENSDLNFLDFAKVSFNPNEKTESDRLLNEIFGDREDKGPVYWLCTNCHHCKRSVKRMTKREDDYEEFVYKLLKSSVESDITQEELVELIKEHLTRGPEDLQELIGGSYDKDRIERSLSESLSEIFDLKIESDEVNCDVGEEGFEVMVRVPEWVSNAIDKEE